jgi:3-methylcrotonyl-CoA carboxylase alpha subunit/acetyl-CoA/propionyl-CoA carboxylase biotin carboxyl carrier protein
VESALEPEVQVGTAYDPMLAKVIGHGPTREAARRVLVGALDESAIFGLTTNLGFLRALVASVSFGAAEIDTGWLDRHPDTFASGDVLTAALGAGWARARAASADPSDPFGCGDAWRLGEQPAPVRVELEHAGERIVLDVDPARGAIDHERGETRVVALHEEPQRLLLELDEVRHEFHVELSADAVQVVHQGALFEFREPLALADRPQASADGALLAPMPGTVLRLAVTPGQEVAQGEVLLILEAMKMELTLTAPFDGIVAEVKVGEGEQVAARQLLAEISEADRDG